MFDYSLLNRNKNEVVIFDFKTVEGILACMRKRSLIKKKGEVSNIGFKIEIEVANGIRNHLQLMK